MGKNKAVSCVVFREYDCLAGSIPSRAPVSIKRGLGKSGHVHVVEPHTMNTANTYYAFGQSVTAERNESGGGNPLTSSLMLAVRNVLNSVAE